MGSTPAPALRVCLLAYITLYAVEGAVRYGLALAGADAAILARDALILLPLAALFASGALRGRPHPAFWLFGFMLALHGAVMLFNFGSIVAVLYGAKILVNVILGLVVGRVLVDPDRTTTRVYFAVWAITVAGVVVEKLFTSFPWVGMLATIGGLTVDVGRDWQITDLLEKRVGGFTRSSIAVAELLPTLALLIACRTRAYLWRVALTLVTLAAVFLTTQKGGLVGYAAVGSVLLAPRTWQPPLLRAAAVAAIVLAVALPLLSSGLIIPHSEGVYSASSFAMRVDLTWPAAFRWIAWNQIFPFGVGLGGIGGPQRFFAPNDFNPGDNVFVLAYGFFGLFAIVYLGAILWLVLRSGALPAAIAVPALATLAFQFLNGAVLSIVEDQVAALFLGAAIGALWTPFPRAAPVIEPPRLAALPPRRRTIAGA